MNDVEFIQDFMKQANDLAESDLMKIPDTANGNNSKSVSQRASRVRMSTQSQNQKQKGQNSPVITANKGKTAKKPPMKLAKPKVNNSMMNRS